MDESFMMNTALLKNFPYCPLKDFFFIINLKHFIN